MMRNMKARDRIAARRVELNKPGVPILSPPELIDYSERLFRIKQLEYKLPSLQGIYSTYRNFTEQDEAALRRYPGNTYHIKSRDEWAAKADEKKKEIDEITTQISKLLEDE